LRRVSLVSALPPKVDTVQHDREVRFVPIAEIGLALHDGRKSNGHPTTLT